MPDRQPCCSHCGGTPVVSGRLCGPCRREANKRLRAGQRAHHDANEPTEEEVEATVAEQSRSLPSWWRHEPMLEERMPKIYRLVKDSS